MKFIPLVLITLALASCSRPEPMPVQDSARIQAQIVALSSTGYDLTSGGLVFSSCFILGFMDEKIVMLDNYCINAPNPLLVFDIAGEDSPEFLYSLPRHHLERTVESRDTVFNGIPIVFEDCGC
jgi:hypothetical protein